MAYASEQDMLRFRPDILSLGTASWSDQLKMADTDINRYLDTNWYRGAAQERGFNWKEEDYAFDPSSILKPEQLTLAATYLALSLAYGTLAKNTGDDGFAPQRDDYRKLYDTEMEAVVLYGIDYEWPDAKEETAVRRAPRGLVRG